MSNALEKTDLADPWWRLNNLYYIKDKKGKRILFKPNWAQEIMYRNMWYLSIILKARQLGMTTFIQLFMLDRCLFNDNQNAGIVAHNKEDAQAFFADKIKFAYDNLPADLRQQRKATSDTSQSLRFSNGSMIRVGNFPRNLRTSLANSLVVGFSSFQCPIACRSSAGWEPGSSPAATVTS